MESTAAEDDEELEDLVLGEKTGSREENTVSESRSKAQEIKMGGYLEALKRIDDIEKELRGVEGQILIKKRKFSS